MKLDRNKRAKLNGLISLAYHIVLLICGFVVPRLMLGAFGSEAYGAMSSITQLLAYIALLEGGVGGVARAVLYGHLAKNDIQGISAIMSEVTKFFRVIGCIFLAYVIILACSFKSISNVECLDWASSFALVIVISISTLGQYFIGISNAVLLQAAQKLYITNTISIFATVFNTICIVVMVHAGFGLIIVKLVSSCVFLMRPVLMYLYARKNFKLDRSCKSKGALKQKWDGLAQHVAFFLHSNTDIVVLTCFANLSLVAVYSVYNLIVSHLQNLVCSCVSGMEALFGDMLAKGEHELLNRSFEKHETLISIVAVAAFSAAAMLIVPFVRLYTEGVTDANYIAPVFAVVLITSSMFYCLRQPYHAVVIAAGHFKQTQIAACGEVVINVLLSILLVGSYGLVGVAFGTLCAVLFRFAYYAHYLSKNIIGRRLGLFAKRTTANVVAFVLILLVGVALAPYVEITNYLHWALYAAAASMVSVAITLGVNAVAYRNKVVELLRSKLLKGKAVPNE